MLSHYNNLIIMVVLFFIQVACNQANEPPEEEVIPFYDEGCVNGKFNQSVKGKILFTSRRAGEYQQLFTMDPDGLNIEQLTFGEYRSLRGRWSKDGGMIAFLYDIPSTTLGIPIYIMNSNGSNKYPLITNASLLQLPLIGLPIDWSPENAILVSGTPNTESSSIIIKPDGEIVKNISAEIKKLPVGGAPFYSPDFSKIALSSIDYIYILDSNFTNLKKIQVSTGAGGIAWSPDGCKIVYGWKAETNEWGELFIYHLDKNEIEQLTFHSNDEQFKYPRWSPDSKKVIFCSEAIPTLSNGFSRNTYIKVVNIETKEITKVISDSTATYPDWSWSDVN